MPTEVVLDIALRATRLGLAAQWSALATFTPRASLPHLAGLLLLSAIVLWTFERATLTRSPR